MEPRVKSMVALKDCIYLYSDASKQSDAAFRRLWAIAFRGFVQMGLNSAWYSKTVTLKVNDNATVTFPCDYINWISIKDSDGNMVTPKKIDILNKCFLFDVECYYETIDLTYLSSPELDTDYEIPIQYQEAMISWLSWQDIANMPSTSHVNNNTIQMRAMAFKAQLNVAKKSFKPFRLQEANYPYLTSFTQSYEL